MDIAGNKRRAASALVSIMVLAFSAGALRAEPTEDEQRQLRSLRRINGAVIWASNRDGGWAIYSAPFDMSEVTRLSPPQGDDHRPRFSPDGKRILFVRSARASNPQAGHGWDIWTMNRDGTEPQRVVANGSNPDWTPDGESIVFLRDGKIMRHDLGANYPPTLVIDPARPPLNDRDVYLPTLAPRASHLAVTTRLNKDPRVHLLRLTLDGEEIVFSEPGKQMLWSDGGAFVYWVSPPENGARNLRTFYPETGARGRLFELPAEWTDLDSPRLLNGNGYMIMSVTAARAAPSLYLWQAGRPPETAVRLTFDRHANRTPDGYLDPR